MHLKNEYFNLNYLKRWSAAYINISLHWIRLQTILNDVEQWLNVRTKLCHHWAGLQLCFCVWLHYLQKSSISEGATHKRSPKTYLARSKIVTDFFVAFTLGGQRKINHEWYATRHLFWSASVELVHTEEAANAKIGRFMTYRRTKLLLASSPYPHDEVEYNRQFRDPTNESRTRLKTQKFNPSLVKIKHGVLLRSSAIDIETTTQEKRWRDKKERIPSKPCCKKILSPWSMLLESLIALD